MVTLIGALFWLLALGAVWRLIRIGNEPTRFKWLALAILIACALLLLFRPHEDIFGGEDPGSYINSGLTYNRQKQLFYNDELLIKVPPEIRPSFYYGHAGYGTTKDACLWIRNTDLALIGPHFQPAYPLMIAFAARIGPDSWALFVVPLFAIFTALALRALASQTIPHCWAGLIAFILYIFNPLTIWHGRCARPEIIAAFMFFGGLALTLQAWQTRPWKNMADILLGAACIGVAPLFHITAWALVIPAGLAVIIAVILKGRDDFLPYLLTIGLMLTVFYVQTKYFTDYYAIRRFLDLVFLRPGIIAAGFILLTALTLLNKRRRHLKNISESLPPPSVPLLLSLMLGICLIAFLASLIFFRQIYGDLPVLGRPVKNYLYLTDFRVVANMLSAPIMLLILAGLIAWLTGRAEKRAGRVILAMVLLPAVILTGNIHDFMMTRYLMTAFIPASALLLTALVVIALPAQGGLGRAVLLSAIICGLALNKRSHLVTTTEHKGFGRFLRPYAEVIKANKGILLCEYSRIAAPLEHFFGVPTLGLDNERRADYEEAEKAWADIMRSMPERPAFFATPYHVPLSAYFDFEPVFNNAFQDRRLEQARQSLPTRVGKSELVLHLYRMKLKQPQQQVKDSLSAPAIIKPDAGNMGWRHFANMRNEPFLDQTAAPPPDLSNFTSWPAKIRQSAELLMAAPKQPVIQARWARKRSQVLLPASRRRFSLLMIYLKAPDPDGSNAVSLQLTLGREKLGPPRKIKSDQWQWQVWQLPPSSDPAEDAEWLTLETKPAWNPGKPNFPKDLGILISQIVCLPAQ